MRRVAFLSGVMMMLTACTSAPARLTQCDTGPVQISKDFPGGAFADCSFDGSFYRLSIAPEAEPINPSPWYAFDVVSTTDRPVPVLLTYQGRRHRYHPWMKRLNDPRASWVRMEGDAVGLSHDRMTARFRVPAVQGEGVRIAAYHMYQYADMERFLGSMSTLSFVERRTIGRSVDGRLIDALEIRAKTPDAPWIVLLGRQHPPELAGAVGMDVFTSVLVGDPRDDLALARRFRDRFNILIIPMINPDGVEAGYWRFNKGLVDLNRDWGPFTQPETRAVRDAVLSVTGGRVMVMLDFHATRRDVFYTQPDDLPPELQRPPVGFVGAWLGDMERILGEAMPDRKSTLNSGQPNAKNWFFSEMGAHSMTVEFGDDTPLDRIGLIARTSARSFMDTLLRLYEEGETE